MLERGLFNPVDTFTKPVIAMVNGYCLGCGCELALACDIRVAERQGIVRTTEINLGIIPGGGGNTADTPGRRRQGDGG